MKGIFSLILLLSFCSFQVNAQDTENPEQLAQLSGAVLFGDSLMPIPYAHVVNISKGTGTVASIEGYFSIIAAASDTVLFSYVGYKPAIYVLPDTLQDKHYTLIQMLDPDTFLLDEVIVLPWATYEQFKQALLDVRLPDDDLQRAKRNLEMQKLKSLAARVMNDPEISANLALQKQNSYLYNAGRFYGEGSDAILNTLSNPMAWASFIKALKNGDFKNE